MVEWGEVSVHSETCVRVELCWPYKNREVDDGTYHSHPGRPRVRSRLSLERPIETAASSCGNQGRVGSVAFAPDGKLLASAGGKTDSPWDPTTGNSVAALEDAVTRRPGPRPLWRNYLYVALRGIQPGWQDPRRWGGLRSGAILLWDVATRKTKRAITSFDKLPKYHTGVVPLPTGRSHFPRIQPGWQDASFGKRQPHIWGTEAVGRVHRQKHRYPKGPRPTCAFRGVQSRWKNARLRQ